MWKPSRPLGCVSDHSKAWKRMEERTWKSQQPLRGVPEPMHNFPVFVLLDEVGLWDQTLCAASRDKADREGAGWRGLLWLLFAVNWAWLHLAVTVSKWQGQHRPVPTFPLRMTPTYIKRMRERRPVASFYPMDFGTVPSPLTHPICFPSSPTCYSLNPGPHRLVKLSALTFFLTGDLTNFCHWRSGAFPRGLSLPPPSLLLLQVMR